MPAPTGPDYPTQLQRNVVIDIRQFGCKCDGSTDDTTNFQAAINSAGVTSPTGSATIQVPRGRTLVTTALRMPRAGIIIQGFGMMGTGGEAGFGGLDPIPSTIVANNSHDNTPMLSMDPAFYSGSPQFLRGSCLRDISFDVSLSTRYTTGTPPVVLNLIEVSNAPEFVNVMTYGSIGTQMYIGPNSSFSGNPISENLVFRNCYFFGGYGGNSTVAIANMVIVQASDNIRFEGGFISYNGPLTINDNVNDIAGIQILPGVTSTGGGYNNINNGIVMNGTAFSSLPVAVRLTNVDHVTPGSPPVNECYCPRYARFTNLLVENYNKVFAINQETTAVTPGQRRSTVSIRGLVFGGNALGPNQKLIVGSKMQGGYIELNYLNFAGDLNLDSTTTGVEYHIGANPNGAGAFFDAADTGSNAGHYVKNGYVGRIFTGQTRFMGTTVAPSVANQGTGNAAISCWGDTVKLWNTFRTLSSSSDVGQIGELVWYPDFTLGQYVLALCINTNSWRRTQMLTW